MGSGDFSCSCRNFGMASGWLHRKDCRHDTQEMWKHQMVGAGEDLVVASGQAAAWTAILRWWGTLYPWYNLNNLRYEVLGRLVQNRAAPWSEAGTETFFSTMLSRWYFVVWLDEIYGDIADEDNTIMAWSWLVYWSIQRVSWHIYMGSHIHRINIHITYWPGPTPFWGRPLGQLRILIDVSLSEHKYWLSAFSAVSRVRTPGGRGKLSDQPPHPIGVNKATHRSCNQFSIETYNNNKPD